MFGAWTSLPDVPKDGEPKATPPEATPTILPRPLVLKPAKVTYHKNDYPIVKHFRNTFRSSKLKHLRDEDFRKFNVSSTDVLSLEELLPSAYIPPMSWLIAPQNPKDLPSESIALAQEALLSNGARRPGHRKFLDFSKELLTDLRTVYRSVRRDPAPQGEQNLRVLQFRKFWIALHNVGRYWDDSLDNSIEVIENTNSPNTTAVLPTTAGDAVRQEILSDSVSDITKSTTGGIRLGVNDPDSNFGTTFDNAKPVFTYTGRRTSTGSLMDSILSLNLAEAFLEPLMYAFGCHFDQTSRGVHDLYLVNTIAPCLVTKLIYSKPKDPLLARQGVLEGPIAIIHAHASVAFGPGTNGDVDQFVRELKAILLCGQQRSREHELPVCPGAGEWWSLSSGKWGHTTSNGVGGLPGEAIGEPLTDLDLFPQNSLPPAMPTIQSASMPALAQINSQELVMADEIEDNSSVEDEADTRLAPTQSGSPTDHVKAFPLTGSDLKSRLMESTLSTDFFSSKNGNVPLTDTLAAPEILAERAEDYGFGASKKRSFEAIVTPSHSPNPANANSQGIEDMDAELTDLLQIPTSHHIAGSLNGSDSEIRKTHDPVNTRSNDPDNQVKQNHWYRLMLESVRKGKTSEQKARKAFTERANQPARELFPETFKKSKRIGVTSTSSRDDIYLISVVNHHIAFVQSTVDHKLIDWLSPNPRERARVTSTIKDTTSWWGIPLRRSRWYNLFDEQDRVEALRATWTIFGKMMADPENDLKAAMAARDQTYGTTAPST